MKDITGKSYKPLRRFKMGQRVLVHALHGANGSVRLDPPMAATVRRIRMSDDAAWVALDGTVPEAARMFPADDPNRGNSAVASPADCEGSS